MTTVIVDGKVRVKRGRVSTVDEEALCQEALERCATAWPGLPTLRDRVAHSDEVLATLEALSRLLLRRETPL